MGFRNFDEKRMKTITELEKMQISNNSEIEKAKAECIEQIKTGSFKISVFGNYSNGKSMLLNAMMQFKYDILEEDELACTATITRICFPTEDSLENKAHIIFKKSGEKKLVSIDEVKNYSAKQRNSNNSIIVEEEIEEVIIYVKSDYLKYGVEIIDTPGFNSTYLEHTEIARQVLNKSDAAMFLFDYTRAGTATEFDFLSDLQENIKKAFLVLNKADKAENEDKLQISINKLRKKLENEQVKVGEKVVYPISAKLAKIGIQTGSEEMIKDSRLNEFADALESYLCSEEFENDKILSPIYKLERKIENIRQVNENSIKCSNLDKEELNRHWLEKNEEYNSLKKDITSKKNSLITNVTRIFSNSQNTLYNVCETVQDDMADEIKKYSIYRIDNINKEEFENKVYREFGKNLKKTLGKISDNIEELINEQINDLTDEKANKNKREILRLLESSYEMTKKGIDYSKINYSQTKQYEDKLNQCRNDLEEKRKKLNRKSSNAKIRIELENKIKDIQKEYYEIEEQIDSLNTESSKLIGTVYLDEKEVREERKGFGGEFLNLFDGGKKIIKSERKIDTTYDELRKKSINEQISNKSEKIDKKHDELTQLKTQNKDILDNASTESEERFAHEDLQESIKIYSDQRIETEKVTRELKKEIVEENKNKLIESIENISLEYLSEAQKYLRNVSSNVALMIPKHFKIGEDKLEVLRKELKNIEMLSEKDTAEIEKEIEVFKNQNSVLTNDLKILMNIDEIIKRGE